MTELYSGSCVKRACRENIEISKRKNNKNLHKTELYWKETDNGGKQRLILSGKKKKPRGTRYVV